MFFEDLGPEFVAKYREPCVIFTGSDRDNSTLAGGDLHDLTAPFL
jgi:hypothetical protein